MRRVLIVSYHYPPRQTVGSNRVAGLVKYLPEFGWKPHILTAPIKPLLFGINGNQNVRSQMADFKRKLRLGDWVDRFITFYGEFMAYPDRMAWWDKVASPKAEHFECDAVISSSPPPTCHVIASKVDKPWVADFRDLWSQNHAYPYSRYRRERERAMEKKTLDRAKALVTVSEPLKSRLQSLHQKPTFVIPCGFDPETMILDRRTKDFTLTYTGNLYPQYDLELLFRALQGLEIKLRFYGTIHPSIDRLSKKYSVNAEQHGVIPRHEALAKQRESHALLLFKWNGLDTGVYSAKIWEYLAAMRPIVAVGGKYDVVSRLLEDTRAGTCHTTVESLRGCLGNMLGDYRQFGSPHYYGIEGQIMRYNYREMAKRMAGVLDAVC